MKAGTKLKCKLTGDVFTVTAYTSTYVNYCGMGASGKCLRSEMCNLFEVQNGR